MASVKISVEQNTAKGTWAYRAMPSPDLEVEIKVGAGFYTCGEANSAARAAAKVMLTQPPLKNLYYEVTIEDFEDGAVARMKKAINQ